VTAEQAFPGATGVTLLDVYDWPTADGLRGGSAHIHLASTEGYLVLRGAGRLQTLGRAGFQETPLRPGDCLWFTPGTVHRLVNDDGQLQIMVVMQNAGLPEVGDCVLTFPPEVLADPARYQAAATLSPAPDGAATAGPDGPDGQAAGGPLEASARRRRDLAIEGFLALREQVLADGPAALEPFLAAAVALTAGRVPDWRRRWRGQAAAVSALTGQHLDGIEAGAAAHLRAADVLRVPRPAGPRSYGMCGRLTPYPAARPARD
jgi:mannose-6-phosphate isomerase-like protein (cupin superfamily)